MHLKNILIVDDSSTSRMIIQRCFQMAGFSEASFLHAGNGLEAFQELEKTPGVDLVVTDLNMPKMNGENFIRALRMEAGLKTLAVVVISSLSNSELEEELAGLGAIGFINKPVSPENVYKVMGRFL